MKTTLIVIATFALSVATAFVVAQTGQPSVPPAPPSISTANAPTPYPPPPLHHHPTQGNDAAMQGNAAAQGATAVTQGEQATAPGMPITPFEMLDRDKAGTLTMDQARNDPWLAQHFAQCDANHDDQVTQSEYATCITPTGQ